MALNQTYLNFKINWRISILLGNWIAKINYCVGVCFWPPVSIPWPDYEVMGFQPQPVDIPDLGYVHPPSIFSSPPTSKMHENDGVRQTKNIKWAHWRSSVWVWGCPNNLGTMYSNYSLSPKKYERQWHEINDTYYNIQVWWWTNKVLYSSVASNKQYQRMPMHLVWKKSTEGEEKVHIDFYFPQKHEIEVWLFTFSDDFY